MKMMVLASRVAVGRTSSLWRNPHGAISIGSAVAWKSTVAPTASSADTSTTSTGSVPQLQHVPTLPFMGSLVPQYSNTPIMDTSKTYDYWPEMTRRFGEFYTMGIPGIGAGWHQTVYVIQDPQEMMKVLRSEGKFPSGAAQTAWGLRQVMDHLGNTAAARIIDQGPEWKRVRGFFQQDLLSPQSARQYIPGIAETAQYASRGVTQKHYHNNLNTFFEDAAFDMFCGLVMGSQTHITDPDVAAAPQDEEFCRAAKLGLTGSTKLSQDVKELVLGKFLGYKTAHYKEFEKVWEQIDKVSKAKVDAFLEKRDKGTLSELEKHSYLQQALDRQEQEESVTREECCQLVQGLLSASVDTTAGMTAWHLVHISMHRETQERIRDELVTSLESTNGVVTAETVSPKSAPYLHAAFRESHRMTNPSPMVPIKRLYSDAQIHGVNVPTGSVVCFDGISKSMNLVPDPETFDPDRWLPEAVEARKGTPAAVLDHVLFKGPFSEGARKCPGSRVAKNEGLLLVAQMILDWEMENPLKHWREIKYKQDTVITPVVPDIQFTART